MENRHDLFNCDEEKCVDGEKERGKEQRCETIN